MRFIRPTVIILLFIFLGLFLIHNLESINQDIGRHLKSGQIIWESKSIYKTNLFSFTEPDHPFINHHWLSEVVFFLLHGWVGLKGLIVFKVLVISAAFALVCLAVRRKTGLWPLLLAMPLGILVLIARTDVRPEIFSYLFFAFFLWAIFKAKLENNYRWLYTLPIVEVLWVNMHIYFILGPILLSLFLIDQLVHRGHNATVVKALLLTSAATLLNPNWLQGALLPFHILTNYGYTIVENQSTSFLRDYGIMLRQINILEFSLVILILSFVVAIKNGSRKKTFEMLTMGVFAALALKMVRNFGIYTPAFIPIFAVVTAVRPVP
jgi:hypothetical protein